MNKAALLAEIMRLSEDERAELAEEILDSLSGEDDDFVLTDELKAELDRRIAVHEKYPSRGKPWEQVMAELRSRFK